MQYNKLKKLLDTLYLNYKHKYSSKDPVWNLHRFSNEKDIELAGLITAAYAYGSVDLINRFIELFLNKIGNKPYEFIINFSKHKDKKYLEGLNYRFNSNDDLLRFLNALNKVLVKYRSLSNLFKAGYSDNNTNILSGLENFAQAINSKFPAVIKHSNKKAVSNGSYHHYLISSPVNGSTCKRMNLFLRWMVRKDEIDFGIWNFISPSRLIMPVDVHIARAAWKLDLVNRRSVDLKYAIELTDKLKQFDPHDPVKYDFSLCHIGMEKKNIFTVIKA